MTLYIFKDVMSEDRCYTAIAGNEEDARYNIIKHAKGSMDIDDQQIMVLKLISTLDELEQKTEDAHNQVYNFEI